MRNKKKLIIYSIISIAIILSILVILYFTTEIFKSNQQLFYKYLGQVEIIDKDFVNKYNEVNDEFSKKSNSSNMKVKVLNLKNNQETQVSDIQEVFAVDSKGLKNVLLNQYYRDFVFSNDNQTFLTVKTLKDNNTYGIIADNILVKYLSVDNSNLNDLFAKLKLTNTNIVPDSIKIDYKDFFDINYDTLEQIKETYFNLIYENIKKENYYKVKKEDKTEILGVTLSEQEVFDIKRLILNTAKNDETLLNVIVNKLHLINYNNINLETMQLKIQEHIDEINNNTYSSEKDYLNIFLTIKEEKVLSIEFEIKYKEENNADETIASNNEYKKNLKLNLEDRNKISFNAGKNNQEIFNILINYIYDDEKINLYTEIDFYENEQKNTFKIQYQISDYQTENIKQVTVLDIILFNNKYQIDIKNNIELKENIQISKLTTENSVKINEMTSEQLEQIKNALLNRINELYNLDLRRLYKNSVSREK